MRPSALAFSLLLIAAAPSAAVAAPTCQDRTGGTIRCGVEGAMPAGWTLPENEAAVRDANPSQPSDTPQMWNAVILVALLLSLFAAMPEFDGATDADWDRQERDR